MGEIVVGIDIGTTKVSTSIGRLDKANKLEILGKGISQCSGVKKGIIVDIDKTSSAIKSSVQQAEAMANLKVGSAYTNIIGSHVSIFNSRETVSISGENREITPKDIEKLLNAAKNVKLSEGMQLIDIIPQQFIVDDFDEIVDPVGMVGMRLEIDADVVAGKITSVQNIVKSAERAGIRIDGIIVEALAAGEMALTADEKDMGAVLIDIGGGVTDVSVFRDKRLVFYDTLPVGGDHITNDISVGLKISYSEAEKIKREYELALTSLIKNDQEITVTDINDDKKKSVKISEIVEIIEARVQEIFFLVKEMLAKAGLGESYGSGVVLTGGGISFVDGGIQLAGSVFNLPVRIASYKQQGIEQVEYATSAGIIRYISNLRKASSMGCDVKILEPRKHKKKSLLWEKIARLFERMF